MFSSILALLKAIPEIISLIKSLMSFVNDWNLKQIDDAANKVTDATRKLNEAKTDEERKSAEEDIVSGSF